MGSPLAETVEAILVQTSFRGARHSASKTRVNALMRAIPE